MFQVLESENVYCFKSIVNIPYLRTHVLFLQILLRQSEVFLHARVLLHVGQIPPPQSTSVSSWFLMMSVHVSGARITKYLLIQISKNEKLTNTCIVSANITETVGSIRTRSSIVTFRTYNTTTVHICFILIFDSVNACFRCWNQKTFTVSNLLLIFHTYERM